MSEWWIGNEKIGNEGKKISGTEYFYWFDKGNRFVEDKVIVDTQDFFILLDGVIFNKKEILKNCQQNNWSLTIIDLYKTGRLEFVNLLRGSFNGVVIDKISQEVNVFVDQLGERAVFYNNEKDEFFVSTDFNRLIEVFKYKKLKYSIDKDGIKNLLYFGYMIDNRTCVKEIKRIFPGNYLYKNQWQMSEVVYFRFSNKNLLQKTEEELIELIDKTFQRALKRELDKDKEYGYRSLIDISGGMDARTISFVAKALGYKEITNICYSQMNAYERKIAEKLVRELGNDYIFKALDNAKFIYEVDDLVKENFGLCYFAGITGGRDFLKVLDKTYFGIEHTGISPFADIDFLNLMFSIPLEQRITGKIYMKWLNKKYPEALEYTYAGTMCKPNSAKLKLKLRVMWNILLLKFLLPIQKKVFYRSEWNYKGTMNPFEYWYEKNQNIRKFVDEYYQKTLKYVEDLEIKGYIEEIQKTGRMQDKMIMLTVLSVYKQYSC